MTLATTSALYLTPHLRQELEHRYHQQTLHSFASNKAIPLSSSEVWVVCRGVVMLSTLYDTGEEALLGLAGPSVLFGLPLTQVDPYQATAFSAVDLIKISMAELEHSPLLCRDLFRSLNHRLQQTEQILAIVGQRRVEDRLRWFLQLLSQEVGQPWGPGTRLTVRFTHQHLANAVGTTRVTITRLLGQLRRDGLLDLDDDRHLILLDPCLTSSATRLPCPDFNFPNP